MYERFTDRARKVMQLANQIAQSYNYEQIDTIHILRGLLKEGSGTASYLAKYLNVDWYKLDQEACKYIDTKPDMVIMGKLPQTPKAKEVIEYAIKEARSLNHNYVGTEHLLLGILRHELTYCYKIARLYFPDIEIVREALSQVLNPISSKAEFVKELLKVVEIKQPNNFNVSGW